MKIRDRFKSLITTNEGRSEAGGLFVVIGLFLEVWLAFKFRTHKSVAEEWGPLIADFLVASGVFVELYFGRKASDESNERVAAAELETEKLRALFSWRRLSYPQAAAIQESLAGGIKSSLSISYPGADPEANTFAREIGAVFFSAGWGVRLNAESYGGGIAFGVRVPAIVITGIPLTDDRNVNLLNSGALVQQALSKAGIEFTPDQLPEPFMTISQSHGEVIFPCPVLYVGPKIALMDDLPT